MRGWEPWGRVQRVPATGRGDAGVGDAGVRALRLEATLCARAVHVREAVVWLGLGVGLGLGLGLGLGVG